MQKIDALRQEIQFFEVEIAKLKQELNAASQVAPKIQSGSAVDISTAYRVAAVATHERIVDVQAIRGAIAELTDRLQPKKLQLGELEGQQLKQHRLERIEEGRSRLRAKFGDVEQAAESLKNLYFELKAIALEYETDFATIHPPHSGTRMTNRAALLNYELIRLPKLTEVEGRFVLGSRTIDLFAPEQKAAKDEQTARSRSYREMREKEWAEIKQQKADEEARIERQERSELLLTKRAELVEWQTARIERLSSLATANVSYFDDGIAKVEVEIENLEKLM